MASSGMGSCWVKLPVKTSACFFAASQAAPISGSRPYQAGRHSGPARASGAQSAAISSTPEGPKYHQHAQAPRRARSSRGRVGIPTATQRRDHPRTAAVFEAECSGSGLPASPACQPSTMRGAKGITHPSLSQQRYGQRFGFGVQIATRNLRLSTQATAANRAGVKHRCVSTRGHRPPTKQWINTVDRCLVFCREPAVHPNAASRPLSALQGRARVVFRVPEHRPRHIRKHALAAAIRSPLVSARSPSRVEYLTVFQYASFAECVAGGNLSLMNPKPCAIIRQQGKESGHLKLIKRDYNMEVALDAFWPQGKVPVCNRNLQRFCTPSPRTAMETRLWPLARIIACPYGVVQVTANQVRARSPKHLTTKRRFVVQEEQLGRPSAVGQAREALGRVSTDGHRLYGDTAFCAD